MRNLLCYLLLFGLLSSCLTSGKVRRYLLEHPEDAAAFCADEYPVKERLITGKTEVKTDTSTRPGVVLDCPEVKDTTTGKTYIPKVQCPPQQVVTNTVFRTDTLVLENTAKAKVWEEHFKKALEAAKIAQAGWERETILKERWQRYFWLLLTVNLLILLVVGITLWYRKFG